MKDLATELAHLEVALEPIRNKAPDLFKADWLESPFAAPVWKVREQGDVDFRVRLEDNSFLTDAKNDELLRTFKHFILAQTSYEYTKGLLLSTVTSRYRIEHAIWICEYLIIRADRFKLGSFGLRALTDSDAYEMLELLAGLSSSDAVYQWHSRFSKLLQEALTSLSGADYRSAVGLCPEIEEGEACPALGLTQEQTFQAKAWLWLEGLYDLRSVDGARGTHERYAVNSTQLYARLYPFGTLKRTWRKPRVPELEIPYGPELCREFEGIPVRGAERTEGILKVYTRTLNAFPLVGRIGVYVPHCLQSAANDRGFLKKLPLLPIGRYRSIPFEVVLKSIRDAIEFCLRYGDHLLAAYRRLVVESKRTGLGLVPLGREYKDHLSRELVEAGVKGWGLRDDVRKGRRGHSYAPGMAKELEAEYFRRLRANEGLYELLEVFWGSLLVITGGLMARRQGELIDLVAGEQFDKSGTRLAFRGRKRNERETRELLHRPAPPLLTSLLKKLEDLQRELISIDATPDLTNLFSFPSAGKPGLIYPNDMLLNQHLNRFCDYFETVKDDAGRRYYIRCHQLRRFFAMLFFWGNSFGGLETLRWFLGQSDPEHLYRYITESIPGAMLIETKIDYAIDQLRKGDSSAKDLGILLKKRFGVPAIQLLDTIEMADYLELLITESRLEIAPHFFRTHSGREYNILITVNEGSRDARGLS